MTTGLPPREVTIPDEPLGAALDRAAVRCPQRVAVDFLGAETTYGELADAVARGANALLELGVQPGDRVALAIPNCTAHVVAFYAVLRIGAVVVEHNPTYTAAELAHQLADPARSSHSSGTRRYPRSCSSLTATRLRAVVAVDLTADLPAFEPLEAAAARAAGRAGSGPRCADRCHPRSRGGTASSPRPSRSPRRTRVRARPTWRSCSTPAGRPAHRRVPCSRTATSSRTPSRVRRGPRPSRTPRSSTASCRSSTPSA